MDNTSQRRAVRNYRTRLGERGLARFEVLGKAADRALIRTLARRLAEDRPEASLLRTALSDAVAEKAKPTKGQIYAALRRSPLVGADLDLSRPRVEVRDLDL